MELVAPGVYQTETDKSFVTQGAVVVGAALIGPTPAGPPMVPTVVTTYSQYKSVFGTVFASGSLYYEYLTSLSAKQYFDNGGTSLLVTRIVSGSAATYKTYATASVPSSASVSAFQIQLNDFGARYNGTTTRYGRKWEVVDVNPTLGTFSLNIRQGDDTNTNKVILESWSGLGLDPMQPNYIERVIGNTVTFFDPTTGTVREEGSNANRSEYITIKTTNAILDSLDSNGNLKAGFVSSLPHNNSSGSFAGGVDSALAAGPHNFFEKITGVITNVQGFTVQPYIDALNLLSNTMEYKFKVLSMPGISADNTNMAGAVSGLLSLAQARQDFIGVLDPAVYNSTPTGALSAISSIDNSYVAAYWPWIQTNSIELGRNVWVPASVFIPGIYMFNDRAAAEWWAPAGFNRGGIPSASKAERKLNTTEIATLYSSGLNPIATFPQNGLVVWGQNTLLKKNSYLRKISVRRLVLNLKEYMNEVAKYLVFDPNTTTLRTKFVNNVTPYFDDVQRREGLYAFRIKMDASNNTSDVIDRFELRGEIIIQPTSVAEIIRLNITVAASGIDITQL